MPFEVFAQDMATLKVRKRESTESPYLRCRRIHHGMDLTMLEITWNFLINEIMAIEPIPLLFQALADLDAVLREDPEQTFLGLL